jgi:hypothetical protein
MAENIIIAFPNRTDGATLSGGSWESGLPITNLQNRLISKVARTTDATAASSKITATLAQPLPIRVVGLVNHNLSFTAQWRIRAYDTDSPATLIYDSGWVYVWQLTGTLWTTDLVEWESDNFWYGGYTAEEIAGFTISAFHIIPTVEKIATVWQIDIDDEDENDDGYVQIGRLFIGPGWQPGINYTYGATFGFETNTGVEESLGNVEFFEDREPVRVFNFAFDALSEIEGSGNVLEIARQAGIHREVVVIPDPADLANAVRRNFMGRLRRLPAVEQNYHQTTGAAFEVKEIR